MELHLEKKRKGGRRRDEDGRVYIDGKGDEKTKIATII